MPTDAPLSPPPEPPMARTSVTIPPDLLAAVQAVARARGCSVSLVVRWALAGYLAEAAREAA